MRLLRDQTFIVVCNIRTPDGPDSEIVGTGIFIAKEEKVYLVTAEHVAKDTSINSYIVYCDNLSNPLTRKLIQLNPFLAWKTHSTADIACMEIDCANNVDLIKNRCLPYDHLNFSDNVSRDNELTCVGFPNGMGALGKFTPFTFRSFFASNTILLRRFDNHNLCNFFCLENPSVGGYSGGPVFDLGYRIVGSMTTTTGDTRLYGIIHGTITDATGGKIAAVTPIAYLKDLI